MGQLRQAAGRAGLVQGAVEVQDRVPSPVSVQDADNSPSAPPVDLEVDGLAVAAGRRCEAVANQAVQGQMEAPSWLGGGEVDLNLVVLAGEVGDADQV